MQDIQLLDKKYVWHPFTQMQDYMQEDNLVIESGQDCWLKDINGNRYLDCISSLWVNLLGHNNRMINNAVQDQLQKIAHSTLLGFANIPSVLLAEKLINISPNNLQKVFYSDSGSEGVEIALKMVFQYFKNIGNNTKIKFISLTNGYHGDTVGSVSVGGIDLFHKTYNELVFQTYKYESAYCYRCPINKKFPDCKFKCLDMLERLLDEKHNEIAGIIMEPLIQGAGGMISYPEGYTKKVETIIRQYKDIFFICDEVATGFGRTGTMFAVEKENVHPDVMIIAKGLTGGYLPVAATLTNMKLFEGFLFDYKEKKTFFHGHSYTGNQLGCAAGLATINQLIENDMIKSVHEKSIYLKEKLIEINELKWVGDIRQQGFMTGIELVKNKKTKEPFDWKEKIGKKVCDNGRKYELLLRPLSDVIIINPPLIISYEEIDYMIDGIRKSIADVLGC